MVNGRTMLFIAGLLGVISFVGCATVKEGARIVAGTSMKELTESRKTAAIKQFNMNAVECRQKVNAFLKKIKSYVYARDNEIGLIAIYVSYEDTTPVGIYITVVDQVTTKVEVSSPSTYDKGLIAEQLFAYLEGGDKVNQKEGPDETK